MLTNPIEGELVILRYAKKHARHWPLHDKRGVVVVSGRGKPRNHLVKVEGVLVVVPAGQLVRPFDEPTGPMGTDPFAPPMIDGF